MPFARALTNGTLIYYTTPYPAPAAIIPRPPWSPQTAPQHMALICKPSASFVIEGGYVERYYGAPPQPADWRPAP